MAKEAKPIRVLIADDFKLLRDVIRLYLDGAGDIEVAGEAWDLGNALAWSRKGQADVIIMNDYLPPIDSAYAALFFRDQGFEGAILVVSMEAEPGRIQASLQNGANGFLHKDEIEAHLEEAVRSVYKGKRYLSPRATAAYRGVQE